MTEPVNKVIEKLGAGSLVLVLLNLGIFWLLYSQGVAQHEVRRQLIAVLQTCIRPEPR
jgi:hypothetical protein